MRVASRNVEYLFRESWSMRCSGTYAELLYDKVPAIGCTTHPSRYNDPRAASCQKNCYRSWLKMRWGKQGNLMLKEWVVRTWLILTCHFSPYRLAEAISLTSTPLGIQRHTRNAAWTRNLCSIAICRGLGQVDLRDMILCLLRRHRSLSMSQKM